MAHPCVAVTGLWRSSLRIHAIPEVPLAASREGSVCPAQNTLDMSAGGGVCVAVQQADLLPQSVSAERLRSSKPHTQHLTLSYATVGCLPAQEKRLRALQQKLLPARQQVSSY
jgi:hypothetical protein